ncbi:hypothetical protein [Variovorax boronicumulans]|uniref:hypothetical protein n=1 Tax=Variovorax boronicumulans TaxID=436515 RepID=UPI0027894A0F|nr:hypothetical protein [Variovorax boronicumulans]MDP9994424.1 chromosome segregation ATPase [Variovorax boronicumulans]
MTPEEEAALAAMEVECDRFDEALETLEAQGDDLDTADEADEAEMQRLSGALDALDDRIDAAHATLLAWTREQMACTEALLRIDRCRPSRTTSAMSARRRRSKRCRRRPASRQRRPRPR